VKAQANRWIVIASAAMVSQKIGLKCLKLDI
jgi:hypothetical protein